MRRTTYDKQAVIADIAEKKMTPAEIADKWGLSIGNVYTIKAAAVRAGEVRSDGFKSIDERMQEEKSVLTPDLREHIKDMREQDLTTTEIARILNIDRALVEKVMARGANVYGDRIPKRVDKVGDN